MFNLFRKSAVRKAAKNNDWQTLISQGEFTPRILSAFLGAPVPQEAQAALNPVLDTKATVLAATAALCEPGCIYFVHRIITDANHDANVRKAFAAGAVCVFSRRVVKDRNGKVLPCIPVEEPTEALIRVLAEYKRASMVKTIALTGSIGKTSAKEMLHLVTAVKYKTAYSKNNQNGLGQVARWAQKLPKDTQVFIQETGLSNPGSIDRAARILQPDAFVVTNIGLNHVGYFGGKQENILKEKLNLDKHARSHAVGFVNWDDPLLREAEYRHPVITFAIDNKNADFYAEDIFERNGRISFQAVEKATGQKIPVLLNVVGRHNVGNALTALAVARWLDIPLHDAAKALEAFRPVGTRQNLMWLNGQHVYVDCYNASEGAIASVAATMDTIDVLAGGKRILVLGDIDDKLGERTEEIHRRVGTKLASAPGVDLILAFGAHAAWAAEEAARGGKEALATEDRGQLEAWIRERMQPEDLIAFKGGQQMMLSRTIDNVFGSCLHAVDTDALKKFGTMKTQNGSQYCLLDGYGAILQKADQDAKELTVPAKIDGYDVRVIRSSAFGSRCAAKTVTVSEGVRAVGEKAFHSPMLRTLVLPASIAHIEPNAFLDIPLLTVVCPEDSYACQHIKKHYRRIRLKKTR